MMMMMTMMIANWVGVTVGTVMTGTRSQQQHDDDDDDDVGDD